MTLAPCASSTAALVMQRTRTPHNDDKCALNQCSRTSSIHRIPYLFHFLCETASELAMLLTNLRGHTHVSLRELGNVNFQTTDLHPSFLSLCLQRVPLDTLQDNHPDS